MIPIAELASEGNPFMHCASCASNNQVEFTAEINIHFSGLKNLNKPSVLVFPKVLVCLDCGFSAFTTPEAGLVLLASVTRARNRLEKSGDIVLCA